MSQDFDPSLRHSDDAEASSAPAENSTLQDPIDRILATPLTHRQKNKLGLATAVSVCVPLDVHIPGFQRENEAKQSENIFPVLTVQLTEPIPEVFTSEQELREMDGSTRREFENGILTKLNADSEFQNLTKESLFEALSVAVRLSQSQDMTQEEVIDLLANRTQILLEFGTLGDNTTCSALVVFDENANGEPDRYGLLYGAPSTIEGVDVFSASIPSNERVRIGTYQEGINRNVVAHIDKISGQPSILGDLQVIDGQVTAELLPVDKKTILFANVRAVVTPQVIIGSGGGIEMEPAVSSEIVLASAPVVAEISNADIPASVYEKYPPEILEAGYPWDNRAGGFVRERADGRMETYRHNLSHDIEKSWVVVTDTIHIPEHNFNFDIELNPEANTQRPHGKYASIPLTDDFQELTTQWMNDILATYKDGIYADSLDNKNVHLSFVSEWEFSDLRGDPEFVNALVSWGPDQVSQAYGISRYGDNIIIRAYVRAEDGETYPGQEYDVDATIYSYVVVDSLLMSVGGSSGVSANSAFNPIGSYGGKFHLDTVDHFLPKGFPSYAFKDVSKVVIPQP